MSKRNTCGLLLTGVVVAGLASMGCDKDAKGPSGSNGGEVPERGAPLTAVGGTGNGPTDQGSGATNGVQGNPTDANIHGIGDTPTGRGITTQPANPNAASSNGGNITNSPNGGSAGGQGGGGGNSSSGAENSSGSGGQGSGR